MTAPSLYVATKAIQEAVAGKELDVLAAVGITWNQGRGHVDCPYPDHGGAADWRWDDQKRRAFCSCIGKRPGEKGSHSIFDVVASKEGITFEAAKIRVTDLIGRGDLIKTKHGDGGQRFQATDAHSLLTTPIASRDDTLPVRYLAHRLGRDPSLVPMPSTAVVGLKALDYWDPSPPGSKSKPKQVGIFPCAVFATVDAAGKMHAHRIYLAPGGQGKAELGVGPNGRPRDPKKSAKATPGDNTAGRSVVWGDPTRAPCAIVCEGIETAATVALAFATDIAAGEIVVYAAISAPGVQAFIPWPATRHLLIGADRDEGEKADGRPGSHTGGRVARALGMKHYQAINVAIALPGAAGESVDWLDILRRDGIEAVRAGLNAAVPFRPTAVEIAEATDQETAATELAQIGQEYPLPALDRLNLKYERTAHGVVKIHAITGMENGKPVWEPIATPVGVTARLRYADRADAYGLRVVVQGMDGRPRLIDFDRGELAIMAGSEIRSRLLAAGLRVEDNGDQTLVHVLKAADPATEIVVVSRTGWHRIGDSLVFVGPGGDITGAPAGTSLELAVGSRLSLPAKAGTLEGWKAGIDAATGARDCPHWVVGVLAGFAGTIIALTDLDTCGINLSGLSSAGKSLAQRLAVSVWTSPKLGAGLFQSMRTTENALESLAQSSNGTVLALDEMGHADGQSVGRMIYSIASGVGKSRATKDAKLKDRYSWATFSFFSGESSIEEKIRGDGGEYMAGMAVRIADIDVTGVNRAVPKTTLDTIAIISQNHGQAGPIFVQGMVEAGYRDDPEILREAVLAAAADIAGEEADSARIRAAIPFALLQVAGVLAQRFQLLPASVQVGRAIQWAWDKFSSSSDALALKPDEQAIRCIRQWVLERWDVTVKHVDACQDSDNRGMRLNNREALGWYDETAVYIPTSRIREVAGKSVKEQQIGQVLDQRKMLARRHDAKRASIRTVPKIGAIDCYALKRSEFGRTNCHVPELFIIDGGAA